VRARRASREELDLIASILAFQFSWRVADRFLELGDYVDVALVRGRIRYVYINNRHALTLRPTTGLFTISEPMAEVIVASEPPPKFRVVVRGDREIRGSVLARDIVDIDDYVRAGDEVVIVDRSDRIIGTGRARVSASMARSLEYGEVVRVR
jgi:archaeosine-15-forming tRNA-guanine transglycosylase